jgi:hypothetical protein
MCLTRALFSDSLTDVPSDGQIAEIR